MEEDQIPLREVWKLCSECSCTSIRNMVGKLIGKMKTAGHFMDFPRLITGTMKAPRGRRSIAPPSTLETG